MSSSVERTYMGEARRRISEFSVGVRQLLTKTPEEYVSDAWRSLDPTTHAMSKFVPAKPLPHENEDEVEELLQIPVLRVKFFLDGTLPRVVDRNSACIYSDIPLEPDGGLNLRCIREKWGMYNCQILYRSNTGVFKFVSPRYPDFLSQGEIKQVLDTEGCLRIIENPPRHIARYRRYRKALLAEYNRWIVAPNLSACSAYLQGYFKQLCRPAASVTRQGLPRGKWAFMTFVHLFPLILAPLLWRQCASWLTWAPAMSAYILVSAVLFLQCPASGKSY